MLNYDKISLITESHSNKPFRGEIENFDFVGKNDELRLTVDMKIETI